MKKLIQWRDYEEIGMAKEEIEKIIIDIENSGRSVSLDEVKRSFDEKIRRINRNIHRVFPNITKWSNVVAIASMPFDICAMATNNPVMGAVAGGVQAVSMIATAGLQHMQNRSRWVDFFQNSNVTTQSDKVYKTKKKLNA